MITLEDGSEVVNLCANNYLGLANHPALIDEAQKAVAEHGYGMASVRFICGTHDVHRRLEAALTRFLGTGDTILYGSCFDANGGLFETLLGEEDAVISDSLNHASIIDGVRLSKAQRLRYANNDMADLERRLRGVGRRPVPADRHRRGVLDGRDRRRPPVDLRAGRPPRRHGDGGRLARRRVPGPARGGTPDLFGVADRIDIVTGTLGKALGGASGGLHRRAGPRSSSGCASGPARTCSRTRWPR